VNVETTMTLQASAGGVNEKSRPKAAFFIHQLN